MTPEERAEKQKRLAEAAHFWHNADFTPYNKAVDDIRAEVEAVDAELYNTIQHHERAASFLVAERGDGDELDDEMNELCTDEISWRRNEIDRLFRSNPAVADIHARLQEAHNARVEFRRKHDAAKVLIAELEAELAPPPPKPEEVKAAMSRDEFKQFLAEENISEAMYDEFLKFPQLTEEEERIEELESTVEMMDWELQWANISYERLERISLEKEGANKEEILKLRRISKQNSDKFYPPAPYWNKHHITDVEWVQSSLVPGQTYTATFNPKKDHAQRALAARWGLDLGGVIELSFVMKRLSHLNNVYVELDQHPGLEVLVSVRPWKNHVQIKSALRPVDEGDFYLHLEKRFIAGGIDNEAHSISDLIKYNSQIMRILDAARAAADDEKKRAGVR